MPLDCTEQFNEDYKSTNTSLKEQIIKLREINEKIFAIESSYREEDQIRKLGFAVRCANADFINALSRRDRETQEANRD